jgi:hypothetical protein
MTRSEFHDAVVAAGVVMTLTIVVFLAVMVFISALGAAECSSHAHAYGFPHRWGPFSGCFVRYHGRWWDYDQLITVLKP